MSIDILHPVRGFLRSAGAQVQGDLRFGSDQLAKTQEFIGAELVVLRNAPSGIQHADALVAGPDSVSPMVSRREISAEAHDGGLQFARHGDHFWVHAIDVVSGKKGCLVDQHAGFIVCSDDEVGGLERFDLTVRNIQREFVTLPPWPAEMDLSIYKDVVGIISLA